MTGRNSSEITTDSSLPGAVFSGVRWSAIGQVATQGIRFGTSITLARLLAPQDFGLLGMAVVVTGFVGIFQTLGTHGAIIQKKEISSKFLNSLSLLNLAMGIALGGILALGGPLMAMLYETAEVEPIIQTLGLTFVISSVGIVPGSLLNREMRFDRLVQIEFATAVIQGAAAAVLAYIGWGVWALVTANIVGTTVSTSLLCWASPWRFRWSFGRCDVRSALKFGLNLTGISVLDYLLRNADKFIVGRFLGATSLGYYWMAYNLYTMPVEAFMRILSRVLFPAFSRIQDDDAQLRSGVLRATGGIAIITFPMMTGLAVVAYPFTVAVLGEKWSSIVPLIIVLSPIGVLQPLSGTVATVYLAKGRTDLLFWWNLAAGIVIVASFLSGLPWGIVGVASAYAIVMVPLACLSFVIPFRLINFRYLDLLVTLRPYAGASVVMGGLVLGLRLVLEHGGYGPIWVLAICVSTGIVCYISIILLILPPALADVIRLLPTRFRRLERLCVAAESTLRPH